MRRWSWCPIGMSPLKKKIIIRRRHPFRSSNGKCRQEDEEKKKAHIRIVCMSKCWMEFANERQWPVVPFELQHSFHVHFTLYNVFKRCCCRPLLKWHRIELWRTGRQATNTIAFHLIDHSTCTCYWLDTHTVGQVNWLRRAFRWCIWVYAVSELIAVVVIFFGNVMRIYSHFHLNLWVDETTTPSGQQDTQFKKIVQISVECVREILWKSRVLGVKISCFKI